MADRRTNKFSIFKYPEHATYLDKANPKTNYASDSSTQRFLKCGYISDTNKQHTVIRAKIEMGEDDSHKIPHFDNIVGFRVFGYSIAEANVPEVLTYEQNNDVTKHFTKDGASWYFYKDTSNTTDTAGCQWLSVAGGDYDVDTQLAHQLILDDDLWFCWSMDEWARNKTFSDNDWISIAMAENQVGAGDTVSFYSNDGPCAGADSPDKGWRSDVFDGCYVAIDNARTDAQGFKTGVFVEIVYEDEIPDPITDFEMVPDELDPDRGNIKFSGVSADDLQGYMLFATTDVKKYDFDSLKTIDYDGQTGNFTEGDTLTGGTSGATAYIISDDDGGATGSLLLRTVNGTFVDNETITDEHTGSATANGAIQDAPSWGWVDLIDSDNNQITCFGMANKWFVDMWNSNYKLILTNGSNKGKEYDITDTGDFSGVLTLSPAFDEGDFTVNDKFLIVKDVSNATEVFAIETNRGYFFEREPDDEEYPIYIEDMEDWFTPNTKYYVFVQAIDNLSMGSNGDKSNIVEFVRPKINATTNVKIRSASDNAEGSNLDVFEEVFVDVYGIGMKNTASELKGCTRIEVQTGEFLYGPDTYTTTITNSDWTGASTTINLDLDGVPRNLYRVGQKVVITDGSADGGCIRTITTVGNNSIDVDEAPPSGVTFAKDVSIVYPAETFIYSGAGTKDVKARVYNEEGFASAWQVDSTSPAPLSVPGIGAVGIGPTTAEKDTTEVYVSLGQALPKPTNKDVQAYAIDIDDGSSIVDYTVPVTTFTPTATGSLNVWGFIYDDDDIISPGFDSVIEYDASEPAISDYVERKRIAWDRSNSEDIDAWEVVADKLYIGYSRMFDGMWLEIPNGYDDADLTVKYWDGDSWEELTVTNDTTVAGEDLKQSGTITWTRPPDWATKTPYSIAGDDVNDTTSLYFLELTVADLGSYSSDEIDFIVPMEKGLNYAVVTVTDPTAIDLDSSSVLNDGYEAKAISQKRDMYKVHGVLGNYISVGNMDRPMISIKGTAYTASDNKLSGWSSEVPVFAGAANTTNIPDDVQTLQSAYNNGYLIKITDNEGTEWSGYIENLNYPERPPGLPRYDWSCTLAIDDNR